MYQDRQIEMLELQMRHRHSDGGWGEMVEQRRHYDPSDHDVERDRPEGRVYRCEGCDQEVTIVPGSEGGAPERR